ncbi:MAG: hypothetical protein IJU76_09385 [Desulfovibrionaceae bacterium]|nr:hypothetical protein [Desulfovibrionaceae bacterium]
MPQIISVQEAASILPELIKRVSEGETVLIGNEGQAEVSLNIVPKTIKKQIGLYKDPVTIADDFDAPLPDELLAGFGYK